jgi:hypothetical protein
MICDCLLEDPGFLARAVGKKLALLGSGQAGSLSTTKTGISAGTGTDETPDSPAPEKDADWDQTPVEICQQIIELVPWTDGELVLEPFCGDGNFYRNLPKQVRKDWCEIRRGRNFFQYQGPQPDTIITNPPFRDATGINNLVVPCLEGCLQLARRRVVYFINHRVFNALTAGRLKKYEDWGWGIMHLSIWDVRKWYGRYYLIVWEKGSKPIIGYFPAARPDQAARERQGSVRKQQEDRQCHAVV